MVAAGTPAAAAAAGAAGGVSGTANSGTQLPADDGEPASSSTLVGLPGCCGAPAAQCMPPMHMRLHLVCESEALMHSSLLHNSRAFESAVPGDSDVFAKLSFRPNA